jgi:hypothetical protein
MLRRGCRYRPQETVRTQLTGLTGGRGKMSRLWHRAGGRFRKGIAMRGSSYGVLGCSGDLMVAALWGARNHAATRL